MDCYAYISASHVRGQQLRRLDEAHKERAVGELLGYPPCCIDAFANRAGTGGRPRDPVLGAYANSHPISWYMNVSLLCFDYGLLTHVPCGSECQPSLELAYIFYNFLFSQFPEYAIVLTRMLSTFVIHTQSWGVAAFTATRQQDSLEVNDLLAVYAQSVIGKFIRQRSVIREEDDSVVIDGLILSGNQAKLYHYC
jgi:hypothetical protein